MAIRAAGCKERPLLSYRLNGHAPIPGVREDIEQKKWKEGNQQLARVGMALQDEAALIDSAAAKLEKQK
jgi:hypothetical protein